MADDAARHISKAKRFRRSLATGPTRPSASPIDGWRSDVHAAASVFRLGAASSSRRRVRRCPRLTQVARSRWAARISIRTERERLFSLDSDGYGRADQAMSEWL